MRHPPPGPSCVPSRVCGPWERVRCNGLPRPGLRGTSSLGCILDKTVQWKGGGDWPPDTPLALHSSSCDPGIGNAFPPPPNVLGVSGWRPAAVMAHAWPPIHPSGSLYRSVFFVPQKPYMVRHPSPLPKSPARDAAKESLAYDSLPTDISSELLFVCCDFVFLTSLFPQTFYLALAIVLLQ